MDQSCICEPHTFLDKKWVPSKLNFLNLVKAEGMIRSTAVHPYLIKVYAITCF